MRKWTWKNSQLLWQQLTVKKRLEEKKNRIILYKERMLERQSEWKALKQMIPAETERAEQREKAIHAKELLEAKGKEAEKALLEKIGEKKKAGRKRRNTAPNKYFRMECKKEQLEQAQKKAKEAYETVKERLTEVRAALETIRSLEENEGDRSDTSFRNRAAGKNSGADRTETAAGTEIQRTVSCGKYKP